MAKMHSIFKGLGILVGIDLGAFCIRILLRVSHRR